MQYKTIATSAIVTFLLNLSIIYNPPINTTYCQKNIIKRLLIGDFSLLSQKKFFTPLNLVFDVITTEHQPIKRKRQALYFRTLAHLFEI